MQIEPLWCPVLRGRPFFWPRGHYGLIPERASDPALPGVTAFQPQGLDFCHGRLTNHPAPHNRAPGPQRERAASMAPRCAATTLRRYPSPAAGRTKGEERRNGGGKKECMYHPRRYLDPPILSPGPPILTQAYPLHPLPYLPAPRRTGPTGTTLTDTPSPARFVLATYKIWQVAEFKST
ncbi:hypothetical protein DPEC_G00125260 [Dallia pectoralis]|uniref:Uncharacterized protein n=1 Tax=Dallia pectoralis TaxID=75939 RepID=A0ACC2GR56_DALPE|nr:hypothetical protein DPEC_G00125260 [Dallia pectoralis]